MSQLSFFETLVSSQGFVLARPNLVLGALADWIERFDCQAIDTLFDWELEITEHQVGRNPICDQCFSDLFPLPRYD